MGHMKDMSNYPLFTWHNNSDLNNNKCQASLQVQIYMVLKKHITNSNPKVLSAQILVRQIYMMTFKIKKKSVESFLRKACMFQWKTQSSESYLCISAKSRF